MKKTLSLIRLAIFAVRNLKVEEILIYAILVNKERKCANFVVRDLDQIFIKEKLIPTFIALLSVKMKLGELDFSIIIPVPL
jgi:hypothetical protein